MSSPISFPSSARLCASEGQQEALNRETRNVMFLAVEWTNGAMEEMTEGWSMSTSKALQRILICPFKKCCVVVSSWANDFLMYLRKTRPPWLAVVSFSKAVMITEMLSHVMNHSVLWPGYCRLATKPLILVVRPQNFFPVFRQIGSWTKCKHIGAYFPTGIDVLVVSM